MLTMSAISCEYLHVSPREHAPLVKSKHICCLGSTLSGNPPRVEELVDDSDDACRIPSVRDVVCDSNVRCNASVVVVVVKGVMIYHDKLHGDNCISKGVSKSTRMHSEITQECIKTQYIKPTPVIPKPALCG